MSALLRVLRRPLLVLAVLPVLVAARAGDDEARRLAPLVVSAEARAIVTLSVPIPDQLRERPQVTYVIKLLSGVTLVGAPLGTIAPGRGTSRVLVLTLRIPANAAAGSLEAAEVEFRAADQQPIVQPVTVRIPLRRQVSTIGSREVNALSAGDHVDLAFRFVNDGNAPESLVVLVRAPNGWRVRPDLPHAVVVPRGSWVEVAAQVEIPADAGIGDFALGVDGYEGWPFTETPAAQARTVLRVITNRTSMPGLTLTPIVAVATSNEGSAGFAGATLEGPVNEKMMLRARLLPRARQSGIIAQGLSAVGAYSAPFAASLTGADWEVATGNALVQIGDLSGVNVFGEGIRANARRGDWQGRAVASRPMPELGARGELYGVGISRDASFGRIGGSASHLSERGGLARGRDLTAFEADFESPAYGTLSFATSVGYRESYGRANAGASLSVAHERPQDRVAVSYTHTPGGSEAFARAAEELQITAARVVNEAISLDASYSRTDDRNAVFRTFGLESWGVGLRDALTREHSLTLRAQGNDFRAQSAVGDLGGFGSGSRVVTAGWDFRRGLFSVASELSTGAMLRRSELLGGNTVTSTAAQHGARVSGSRAFEKLGAIDLGAGVQFTQMGVGVPGDAWNGTARWRAIPLRSGRNPITMDAELQYQRIGNLQSYLVARTQLNLALPGGLELAMSAEQNPYYRDARGRAGWIAAMRLSASSVLRAASAAGDQGVVYTDVDGNGRRDPGEQGVAGVVVRRGDARVTTDREGRYRLPARVRGRVRVDQGSLPRGLLAHPMLTADTLERLDLPLLMTGTVTLDLHIVPAEDGRRPEVSLKDARIYLRDWTGFEWSGRHATDSTIVFEDVPAGAYVPRFDLSGIAEPLRFDEGLTVLVLPRERRVEAIPLRGRAVRVITPPRGQRQGQRGP